MPRLAINGYGRIGRCLLRAFFEGPPRPDLELVAINDLSDYSLLAHLTRFDSTHGPFGKTVELQGDTLIIDGRAIRLSAERDIRRLPWRELDIDIVLECSGLFTRRDACQQHLDAGAGKVLLSAPGDGMDATIVYGVNHAGLRPEHRLVSNASCTTNCLAPLAQVLHHRFGIVQGQMVTVHAYTNDQSLIDKVHGDPYRSRSATQSIIPTKTGAAKAVGEVLPELKGKLDGMALRVPVQDVSVVDFYALLARDTTVEEVHAALKEAAAHPPLRGVLVCNEQPLVSVDFAHNPASSIVDLTQTRLQGRLLKTMAWYDNEWGFAHRMLDVARLMA
ncbi:MAG TPA: type I glyceraldehyde-3-phosphate dehydrogenase [Fluviicoccus sp.]|nr:type I glyceraldehyde-3-phosphate dehydrogenase [Fluviicoccus sp.]